MPILITTGVICYLMKNALTPAHLDLHILVSSKLKMCGSEILSVLTSVNLVLRTADIALL